MTTRDGTVELPFADMEGSGEGGKYVFRLKIVAVRELQEKCNAGPRRILTRLFSDDWLIDDVIQPIRLGLIGAGMSAVDAARLTERYVSDGSIFDHVGTAAQIVGACMSSVLSEPLKKKRRSRKPETTTQDSSSSSAPSTSSAPL